MIDDTAEPPRQVWHFALVVMFGFALVVSQFAGQRPLFYGMFNNVAPAGEAPAAMRPDDWSLTIRRSDWSPALAALIGYTRPERPARLGWVVREGSLLSFPLFAWRQSELTVYTEDGYGYRMAGLTTEQRAAVERAGAVGWFPWWRHVWGWLPLAALAGFIWAELRWQDRRRALMGII